MDKVISKGFSIGLICALFFISCGKDPVGNGGNGDDDNGEEPDYEDDFGIAWQLTSLPGNEITPTWSPDGSTIAFVWDGDGTDKIYLTPATGGPITKLTNTEATDPCWSLDGSLILYDDAENESWDDPRIYVIDVNTGGITFITEGTGSAFDPYWFPDMTKIIFVSVCDFGYALYTMEIPGGIPEMIVDPYYHQRYLQPALSTDGTKVGYYFVQDEDEMFGQERVNALVAKPLSGSGDSYFNEAYDPYPTWSPDGSEVAYIANSVGYKDYSDLFVYSFEGGNKRRVVDSPYGATTPSWSPDGKKIAFANETEQYGDYDIWIVELNE